MAATDRSYMSVDVEGIVGSEGLVVWQQSLCSRLERKPSPSSKRFLKTASVFRRRPSIASNARPQEKQSM